MHNPTNILKNNNLQVLYVEDNTKERELTFKILKKFFKNITTAKDGHEGYNKVKENKFDLIITDIDMPKLSGLDMVKKIREIDKDITVIIISAYTNTEYFLKSIQYNISNYILKPIDKEEFSKTIHDVIHKIEEKKQRKKELFILKQYKNIIDKSTIISKTDIDGTITYVNDAFCEISGYTREELIGKKHNIIRAKEESNETFKKLWETIKVKKETWEGVLKNRTKNNGLYYVKATIKPILNEQGEIEEFIALRSLISDIIHPKKQLFDFLKLEEEYVIVLIKIEHFDYIQSSLNKEQIEKLEKDFAQEIFKSQPNKKDFHKIYLLENGEFAFAKKLKDCKKSISDIIQYLKNFKNTINNGKIHIESINHNLSILISFAYGKEAFEDAKAGIKQLIKIKQDFIIANGLRKKEQKEAIKQIKNFNLLREAIDSYNIISYFQPIVNNKTKKIDKYESLVRLVDSNDKVLSPALFLDSAKKGKYYSQITSMVLKNSFEALYSTQMTISINLSVLDIKQSKTKEEFFSLLKQHKDQAHRIIIELTEDENIKDIEVVKEFIKEIRKYNVQIAIDDFGVGLSNFSRILQYQPDYIKIDGSLIRNIESDKLAKSMVETIVNFAKKAKIKTVAEFVENEKIFDILCDLGVDYSQGYYFGKAELLQK